MLKTNEKIINEMVEFCKLVNRECMNMISGNIKFTKYVKVAAKANVMIVKTYARLVKLNKRFIKLGEFYELVMNISWKAFDEVMKEQEGIFGLEH